MQGDDEGKAEGTGFLFPPSCSLSPPFASPYPPPLPLLPSFFLLSFSFLFLLLFFVARGTSRGVSPRGRPRVAHRFRFLEVVFGRSSCRRQVEREEKLVVRSLMITIEFVSLNDDRQSVFMNQ